MTRFHYTNPVHPKLAIVTGMTRDGTFLVEDGRIVGPVRNLRFTQSYLEALAGDERGQPRAADAPGRLRRGARAGDPRRRLDLHGRHGALTGPDPMTESTIQQRLGRPFDPAELRRIKRLWVRHSIAEDRRDIDGLIATLARTASTRSSRPASAGRATPARGRFYTELFGAFPDNAFALTDIVIGPQGVFEVATLTGTNSGPWAGAAATGLPVSLQVLILFPWDPATERFSGERIWFDRGAIGEA